MDYPNHTKFHRLQKVPPLPCASQIEVLNKRHSTDSFLVLDNLHFSMQFRLCGLSFFFHFLVNLVSRIFSRNRSTIWGLHQTSYFSFISIYLCRVILLSTFGVAKYKGMKVNCLHIIFVVGLQFVGLFWLVYHGRQVCCLLCPPTPGYSKSHRNKDLQGVVKNDNSYVWTWVCTFQGFKDKMAFCLMGLPSFKCSRQIRPTRRNRVQRGIMTTLVFLTLL